MENKCNKTPNSNTKYLDHVYCHTTVGAAANESKNYIRANNNSGNGGNNNAAAAGADVLALLKENKQLKAMLILHLDLIQEQSDQLMTKDKQLSSNNEELEKLRTKSKQLETQVQDLQKQLQRQLKRVAAGGELSSLPPPPLAKIQCKSEIAAATLPLAAVTATATTTATNNIIGECNGKLISKIILHRVNFSDREGTHSPNSITTTSDENTSEADDAASRAQHDEDYQDDGEEEEDEEAGEIECDEEATTEDSNNSSSLSASIKRRRLRSPALLLSRGAKPRRPVLAKSIGGSTAITAVVSATATTTTVAAGAAVTSKVAPVQVCVTPPTPSRGKQMPLMLWHTPDMHSDESASCDSMADTEHHSSSVASPVPSAKLRAGAKKASGGILAPPLAPQHARHAKTRRWSYITTQQMYSTREWEDDEYVCDYEFIKEEANALRAEAPMLEIPKWTEHELTVSYCIEGTEDLSDDSFLKRHAKLEVDERRRKKWDVQQIREQRRIEKLKRRHCKDEIQPHTEQQAPVSFYPQADGIENICYINDIPVQAFGEMIPKLSANNNFALPWLEVTLVAIGNNATATNICSTVETFSSCNASASSAQAQQQLLNSSFVLLKKRKRQQSSSTGVTTTRQRNAVAAKAAAQANANTTAQLHSTTAHNSTANTTNTNTIPMVNQSNTISDEPN